jgi:hypothetical protein
MRLTDPTPSLLDPRFVHLPSLLTHAEACIQDGNLYWRWSYLVQCMKAVETLKLFYKVISFVGSVNDVSGRYEYWRCESSPTDFGRKHGANHHHDNSVSVHDRPPGPPYLAEGV